MALGKQLRVEAVRTLDYSGISGSYAPVGSPSTRPDGVLQFKNLTNAYLIV